METEAFWAGTFGRDYLERNKIDPESRVDFWRSAIEYCAPVTVLEVGANRGHNLLAIQSIDNTIDCHGIDINSSAANEARAQGVNVEVGSALEIASKFGHESMDLVVACGLLIHIPPGDVTRVMQAMVDTSAKYVLCVEYMADEETEVEYRGHAGKLWKRPFAKMFQELGCTLISEGVAGGFDRCDYALLTVPGAREMDDRQELF